MHSVPPGLGMGSSGPVGLPQGRGSQALAEQDPAGSPWQCWPGLFPEVSPAPVPAVRVGTASSLRPLWNGGQAHALTQTRTLFTHRHTCAHTLQTVTHTAQSLHTITHAQHTCHTHTLHTVTHTQHTLHTQSYMRTHFTHIHTHTQSQAHLF